MCALSTRALAWGLCAGFHVVAVGYRLSTHAKHPAQIEDVENAVRYLKTNAAEWNLDPTRILAVGASAGGHLASLLGTRNGPSSDARVVGVVNFFGPSLLWGVDGENTKMLLGCDSPSKNGTACYDKAHDASPIEHVAPDNPPFLHFHGTCDTTVPIESSQMLQDALNMSGVAHRARRSRQPSLSSLPRHVRHNCAHRVVANASGRAKHVWRRLNADHRAARGPRQGKRHARDHQGLRERGPLPRVDQSDGGVRRVRGAPLWRRDDRRQVREQLLHRLSHGRRPASHHWQ